MVTGTGFLTAAHIFCATFGYAGLIYVNLWLAQVAKGGDTQAIVAAAQSAMRVTRLSGPILGLGILLGFALAPAAGFPLSQPWLIATYLLMLIGIAIQALVAVPWLIQTIRFAQLAASEGAAQLDTRRPALIAWAFAIDFALIVLMMASKPLF